MAATPPSSDDRSVPEDAVRGPRRQPTRPTRRSRWADWKAVGSYGTVGLEVALSVMFGLFVGRWLDGKLGSSPYLALAGSALGVAAAVRAVLRAARDMERETANDGWRESQADRPARFALDEQAVARGAPDEPHAARGAPDDRSSRAPDRSPARDEKTDGSV